LVVAAHPDDEILGCGGAMARHRAHGERVTAVIMAEGITSRFRDDQRAQQQEALRALEDCAKRAQSIVGVAESVFLRFPDNRMDEVATLDVVQALEAVVERVQPTVVYTHHWADLNVDHQITCRAVMTACRPLPSSSVREILHFEVPSATGWDASSFSFAPTTFIDISDHLAKKLEALAVYEAEMRPFPHARSIESLASLARYRGAHVGLHAAESFVQSRLIVR
jgi:LmbE family N-acetylglucosaminyl deacetylase